MAYCFRFRTTRAIRTWPQKGSKPHSSAATAERSWKNSCIFFLPYKLFWCVKIYFTYERICSRLKLYASDNPYLRTWSLYSVYFCLLKPKKSLSSTLKKENKIVYIILVFKYFGFLDKKTPFLAYLHSFKMK